MKYWKRSGKFLRCPRHQRRLVQGHQVATLFLYVTVYVFFLYTTASASAEGLRSTLTSEVKPSDFRPSADGVTPEDGVAGTRGKAVVFGGSTDPLDTIDHSLDVTNEGDKDTMPVTDPDEWKPSAEWLNAQKKVVKRYNNHPHAPRRTSSEHEIFAPASNEDPRGYMRIDKEYTQPEADDSHPGNEGNHWNNEAGGVDDAIGDGAHLSGSLDAMMEPVTPKVDANSFFGGGGGDNTKAMAEAAKEEMEEDEEDGKFEDWKPSNKWAYNEKDTATEHDRKTHLQQDENWENEETTMAREIGKRQREKKKKREEAKRDKEKQMEKARPRLKPSEESNGQKLQGNKDRLEALNNEEDIDGAVAEEKEHTSKKKNAKLRSNPLDTMQTPQRISTQSASEDDEVAGVLSAEAEILDDNKNSLTEAFKPKINGNKKTSGDKAPRPGLVSWLRTDPHTGMTKRGGAGYLFQKCRKGAAGMCWLPFKCTNYGGTAVRGKCYGGGDTVCCQNYKEFPIHPLPLLVPNSKMPQQLFAGQTVRLKGKSIDIGKREKALFDAMRKAGISGLEACQFLAQMAHESDKFKAMEEYASGRAYEGRADLGNIRPGDGVRYKGRGYIQLTGRANYRYYGQVLGVDLESHPRKASNLDVAAAVAITYWYGRVKYDKQINNKNWENTNRVTYRINGGKNGLNDRKKKFKAYKATLK